MLTRLFFSCLLLIGSILPMDVTHAITLPNNPDGFVFDQVGLLARPEKQRLEALLTEYRNKTSNEIAVVIVDTLDGEPIADTAIDIGRNWGVGTSEHDNGIVMLIAIEDRNMFIATGYGMEGAVPDIVAKGIIDEDITPRFRQNQFFDGILTGIFSLQKHIGGEYTADRYKNNQSGDTFGMIFFFGIFFLQWAAAILGRTKSWWLGGVLGGGVGIVLTLLYSWWLSIPLLAVFGLLFDYLVSKNYRSKRKTSWWAGGGWGPGGGGGGGFGGFSGGNFGGGGAGGSW